MSRLPFEPPKKPAEQAVITVSQLASRIEQSLKTGIPAPIRFIGEVTGFRDRTHWYFDLKDAGAVVSCVMFQSGARRVGFTPANGQQVVARGLVEFYAKGGKVSVVLDSLEPVGAGALELAYRALCEELRGLGYFDHEKKVALPVFPRRVAVVTSKTGAALQDVLVTMRRRCPGVGVLVVDVRVQGDKAAAEVAEAVAYLNTNAAELGIDAILLTRGGGSLEDLWAFNERIVADAIFACKLPVVAAIGHETDTTIAELVADERCATPTQAAVRLTPDSEALIRQVESLEARLSAQVQRRARSDRQRLVDLVRRPLFLNPLQVVTRAHGQLDERTAGLISAVQQRVTAAGHRFEQLASRLERNQPSTMHARILTRLSLAETRLHAAVRAAINVDLGGIEQRLERAAAVRVREGRAKVDGTERHLTSVGPLKILERGFSVTMTADGRAVRSPSEVVRGDVIETRVAGGSFTSTVGPTPTVALPTPPPRTKKPATPDRPPTPGLFS